MMTEAAAREYSRGMTSGKRRLQEPSPAPQMIMTVPVKYYVSEVEKKQLMKP